MKNLPLSSLTTLHLEMGFFCNTRCTMCYQTHFSPHIRMKEALWKEKLLPVYPTLEHLVFQGGEPTVMKNCRELVHFITSNFPHILLDTTVNGLVFDEPFEEAFLKQGKQVNFSINGASKQVYDRIVIGGNWEKLISNLKRLLELRQKRNSDLTVRTSFVILPENIHQMADFIALCGELGIDSILFITDVLLSTLVTDSEQVRNYLTAAFDMASTHNNLEVIGLHEFDTVYSQKYHLKPLSPQKHSRIEKKPCSIPFNTLFINHKGEVMPCCLSWYSFGNLHKQSIEQIWNSKHAHIFRKRMKNLNFIDCSRSCPSNVNPGKVRIGLLRKSYYLFKQEKLEVFKKTVLKTKKIRYFKKSSARRQEHSR